MKDLLVLLGKRVQALRAARKMSQEEFAHTCGLHRTYVGQIERGEKNISFANLLKISTALGITLSELLAGLEAGTTGKDAPTGQKRKSTERQLLEIRRLLRRLSQQRTALDKTVLGLEALAEGGSLTDRKRKSNSTADEKVRGSRKRGTRAAKKR